MDKSEPFEHWWAFLALCQRCHLSVQGRVLLARPWPFGHSVWFQPYVAGYYAWRYQQREVSRSEVEFYLAELLALEAEALFGHGPIPLESKR